MIRDCHLLFVSVNSWHWSVCNDNIKVIKGRWIFGDTHGGQYVALTWGKKPDNLKALTGLKYHNLNNVVYSEVTA
jgi:hypothetical protein